jgi:hypothetical protein
LVEVTQNFTNAINSGEVDAAINYTVSQIQATDPVYPVIIDETYTNTSDAYNETEARLALISKLTGNVHDRHLLTCILRFNSSQLRLLLQVWRRIYLPTQPVYRRRSRHLVQLISLQFSHRSLLPASLVFNQVVNLLFFQHCSHHPNQLFSRLVSLQFYPQVSQLIDHLRIQLVNQPIHHHPNQVVYQLIRRLNLLLSQPANRQLSLRLSQIIFLQHSL